MRVYRPADAVALRALAETGVLPPGPVVVPVTDDEQDEFDALVEAASAAAVVVAADVGAQDAVVGSDDIAAFHLDADGSGDLAWYAPIELDEVLTILGR